MATSIKILILPTNEAKIPHPCNVINDSWLDLFHSGSGWFCSLIGISSTHDLLDIFMQWVNKLSLNFEVKSRQRSWPSAWLQTKTCKFLHFHVHQKTLVSSCWFCRFAQNWASYFIKRPLLAELMIYFCAMELPKKPKYGIS